MQARIVTGDEREQFLKSRVPQGFDYGPYLDILNDASDGDVIAVEIDGSQRGEKLRFSRAASRIGKGVRWLPQTESGEIAFQLVSQKLARSGTNRQQGTAAA